MCCGEQRRSGLPSTLSTVLFFSGLYRLAPSVLNALVIVKPETVIAGIALDCVCSGDGSRELAAEGRML
jgi:hypothetical protein